MDSFNEVLHSRDGKETIFSDVTPRSSVEVTDVLEEHTNPYLQGRPESQRRNIQNKKQRFLVPWQTLLGVH
jgi:hypothetical protein